MEAHHAARRRHHVAMRDLIDEARSAQRAEVAQAEVERRLTSVSRWCQCSQPAITKQGALP